MDDARRLIAEAALMVGSAIGLSDTPPEIRAPAPLLGEHTAEILHRLEYDDEAIAALQAQGVV